MNRIILIFLIAITSINVKAQVVKHVNEFEFKQLVDSNEGIILDVRTPDEVAKGHIKGASTINIGDEDFVAKINMMQKNKAIYVYCFSGHRSKKASGIMEQNGFTNVYNLAHGVMSWKKAGYPLVVEQNVPAGTATIYSEESIKNIINSNDVVLVDFNAAWCAPCKKMLPIVDKIANENLTDLKVLYVDISENQKIAQLYNIKSIPNFIIFKNGEKIWQNTGVISYEDLNTIVRSTL